MWGGVGIKGELLGGLCSCSVRIQEALPESFPRQGSTGPSGAVQEERSQVVLFCFLARGLSAADCARGERGGGLSEAD